MVGNGFFVVNNLLLVNNSRYSVGTNILAKSALLRSCAFYMILDDALSNLQSCCSRTPFTQSLENKLFSARDKVKKIEDLYLTWIREYTSGTF